LLGAAPMDRAVWIVAIDAIIGDVGATQIHDAEAEALRKIVEVEGLACGTGFIHGATASQDLFKDFERYLFEGLGCLLLVDRSLSTDLFEVLEIHDLRVGRPPQVVDFGSVTRRDHGDVLRAVLRKARNTADDEEVRGYRLHVELAEHGISLPSQATGDALVLVKHPSFLYSGAVWSSKWNHNYLRKLVGGSAEPPPGAWLLLAYRADHVSETLAVDVFNRALEPESEGQNLYGLTILELLVTFDTFITAIPGL